MSKEENRMIEALMEKHKDAIEALSRLSKEEQKELNDLLDVLLEEVSPKTSLLINKNREKLGLPKKATSIESQEEYLDLSEIIKKY